MWSRMADIARFQRFLADRGRRLTPERAVVCHAVFDVDPPFTAEDLYVQLRLRQTAPRISRSTVYRTLAWLVDARFLREVSGSDCTLYASIHATDNPADGTSD